MAKRRYPSRAKDGQRPFGTHNLAESGMFYNRRSRDKSVPCDKFVLYDWYLHFMSVFGHFESCDVITMAFRVFIVLMTSSIDRPSASCVL